MLSLFKPNLKAVAVATLVLTSTCPCLSLP